MEKGGYRTLTGGLRRARADLFLLFCSIFFTIYFARNCAGKFLGLWWPLGNGALAFEAVKLAASTLVCFLLLLYAVFMNRRIAAGPLISSRALTALNVVFAVCSFAVMSIFSNHYNSFRHVDIGDGIYFYLLSDEGSSASSRSRMRKANLSPEGYRLCPYSREGGGKKIILAGDSFVFGQGLENKDTLCARVGESFEQGGSTGVSVENLACSGLNMYSAASVAQDYLNRKSADWVVIGYDSGNAFRLCDTYCQIKLSQNSYLYKAASIIFGQNEANRAVQYYSYLRRDQNIAERKRKTINAVAELAKESNVLILSYYGKDGFLEEVKSAVPKNLHFVLFDLPIGEEAKGSDLIIPGDGHPSAKANVIMAGLVHDYIVSYEKNGSFK